MEAGAATRAAPTPRRLGIAGLTTTLLAGCVGATSTPTPPPTDAPPPDICSGQERWSLAVDITGLGQYEGKTAWISAIERDRGKQLVVRRQGRVTQGRLQLSCARSLHTSAAGPVVAVIIDANGSGRCDPSDVQMTRSFYAWDFDVTVSGDARSPWATVAEYQPGVSGDAEPDVCTFYLVP